MVAIHPEHQQAVAAPAASRAFSTTGRRALWVALGVLGLMVVLYVGICTYMAMTLTRPDRKPFQHNPEQFGLTYQSVEFPSRVDELTLKGWLLEPSAGVAPQPRPVVMVHGKGSDRQGGPGQGILGVAAPLTQQGYRVLTFDLRGSGESGGERFFLGAQEVWDVGGAVDYLRARGLASDGVNLQGFSMGAATAMLFAASEPAVRAVVEDAGFADLGQILDVEVPKASGLPPIFTPGMILMGRPLFNVDLWSIRPIDAMPVLADRGVPLLVIHGEADTYVPASNGHRLAQAYGARVQSYFVPGAGHVEAHLTAPAAYDARVQSFFAAVP